MLNVFLKLIAAATAAAIAEALLPDGGAKGGIAGRSNETNQFCPCRGNCGGCCSNCCIMEHGMNEKCRENTFWTVKKCAKRRK